MPLVEFTERGLYCPPANVYIDPWQPVDNAIITHAHSDHSRTGMKHYLAHKLSVPIMKLRLGEDINVTEAEYGQIFDKNGVKISLHPAGHIIGSAQVRIEHKGEVWVASGDYKTAVDGVSTAFEPVKCHHFITESTFGLPVFKFQPQTEVMGEINQWWQANKQKNQTTILVAYALGKAQRVIKHLDRSIGKIMVHGAVYNTHKVLQQQGIDLPDVELITKDTPKNSFAGNIVIAPPSAIGTTWMKKFTPYSIGIASGWMALRGPRRRRSVDRGFVLSDHADWDELNTAIKATEAENIYVTHGYTNVFSEWLKQQGYNATVVQTEFEGEQLESADEKKEETS